MLPPMLGPSATSALLPFGELLAALEIAALQLQQGLIECPARLAVPMADGALLISMPAVALDIVSHKLITVTPGNAARGLPVIRGQVSVLDPHTGQTLLMLDGPTVTGRRTAAMSMLGLRTLWRREPRRILIIGTGAQAQHHADAIATLHPQARVLVRGSSAGSSQRFCEHNRDAYPHIAPATGTEVCDVVITCTTSRTPVYDQAARSGCFIIAVGAFQAEVSEIAASTVLASAIFVDDPDGARHEAGDLILAGVAWGSVSSLATALQRRAPAGQPLLFKTVGCAAWDLAAARVAASRLLNPKPSPTDSGSHASPSL